MFGNASLPSKIFCYGAKRGPVENADACYSQLRAAHRYRNKLVEIERNRRAERDEVLRELFPQLAVLEVRQADLVRAVGEIERTIKDRRAGQHLRLPATKEEKQKIKELRKELKAVRAEHRELKKELRQSGAAQEHLAAVDAKANQAVKDARAACGVFWGTYLQIENAIQQAKKLPEGPQFRRFTGDGKLAVQIQGGMTVEQLFGCQDTRVRLEPIPDPTKRRGRAVETTLWLRIGSEGKNAAPVWATFRVRMDRPLPPDCRIKWVFAVARKIATKTVWSVQFVVQKSMPAQRLNICETREGRAESGAVAVDVGYRMTDAGLRVAYWLGDDGESREVVIPAAHMRQWAQVEDLRSIRDAHFNETREMLAVWRDAHKDRLPEWFREWSQHLRQWRAPGKLSALVIHWRSNRIKGDDVAFAAAEAWRKKDKHLYEWEGNLRRKVTAWRKDFYRCLAAKLASRYKTVVLEEINLKKAFVELPAAEKDEKAAKLARRNRTIAAISSLRRCLAEAFGDDVAKVNPAYTSKRCHRCGEIGEYNDPSNVSQICPNCFAAWDRDYNAVRNILDIFERSNGEEDTGTARKTDHKEANRDKESEEGADGEKLTMPDNLSEMKVETVTA